MHNRENKSIESLIDNSKIKILVVDDEPTILNMIKEFLAIDNYSVTCFNESIHVIDEIELAKLEGAPYDLIISDLEMPNKTGIEIASELKFREIDIPTILISGKEVKRDLSEYSKLQIAQFIKKENLNIKTIKKAIKDIIEPKYAQKQLLHSDNLMNNLPVLVACMDENNDTHFLNDALINRLGYPKDQLLGLPRTMFQNIIHADQNRPRQENNYAEYHAINQDLEDRDVSEGREIKLYAKDGSQIWTFVKAKKNGAHTFFSFTDISERKDLEINIDGLLEFILKTIGEKDKYTSEHSSNVCAYTVELCDALNLHVDTINAYREGAMLHDIGKIGVPGNILRKPSKLSDEEFEIIKTHPPRGVELVKDFPKFKIAIDGILYHHVHYAGGVNPDGSINNRSYPVCKLREREIPEIGRIIAIGDAYDAMTTDRSYRAGLGHKKAIRRLIKGKGTQFDPDLVTAFADAIKNPRETQNFSIRKFKKN